MNFKQRLSEDLRLAVLHTLHAAPTYQMALPMLHDVLRANGTRIGEAELRAEVDWLRNAGLVLQLPGANANVSLLQAGLDVSRGDAQVEGVRRLRPGEAQRHAPRDA